MNLFSRIICAVVGHEWRDAGWLGALSINDDFIVRYKCKRCNIFVNVVEPRWHLSARFNKCVDDFDVPMKSPSPFRIDDPDYSDQLRRVNAKYPIDVLAKIHKTTVAQLQKIGY